MITEDYVSFDTAKLMKEKGFEGQCSLKRVCTERSHNDGSEWTTESVYTVDIPTLQMAMKWLREVHKLWCEISWEGKNAWFVDIFSLDEEQYVMFNKIHNVPSYEQACEAAIKYCLENLI